MSGGREVCDGDVQYKLWILYWVAEGYDWCYGWEYRYFDSVGEVYSYCRDNLELIEIAECGDTIIRNGNMICQDCGKYLLATDVGVYPVCADCDVWED